MENAFYHGVTTGELVLYNSYLGRLYSFIQTD